MFERRYFGEQFQAEMNRQRRARAQRPNRANRVREIDPAAVAADEERRARLLAEARVAAKMGGRL